MLINTFLYFNIFNFSFKKTFQVEAKIKLNHLIFSHIDKIEDVVKIMGKSASYVNFLKVPQQDLSFYSVLQTCPGVIGIFSKPKVVPVKENCLPITIICDNIREPNNVGAVIRLANALPVTRVILPKGCADQWETKAIRGSAGSVFQMPTDDSLKWTEIDERVLNDRDILVLIADNNRTTYGSHDILNYDSIPVDRLKNKQIYLIIGGETHGISDEAKTFAFKRPCSVINIPIDPAVNSLNTSNALAIILFELRRKLCSPT